MHEAEYTSAAALRKHWRNGMCLQRYHRPRTNRSPPSTPWQITYNAANCMRQHSHRAVEETVQGKVPCEMHPAEEVVCEGCAERLRTKAGHKCKGKVEVRRAVQSKASSGSESRSRSPRRSFRMGNVGDMSDGSSDGR